MFNVIKYTVLVVEDEDKIRDLIVNYLKDKYYVFEAEDGDEALQIFEEEHIDLVISDIMMPNVDGWQLLNYIREISDVPYILLSGIDDEISQLKGYDLNINDYIPKPFSLNILLKKVDAVFRRDSLAFNSFGVIDAGVISLDTKAKSVKIDGKEVHLMPKEYDILLFFLENQNEAFEREYLLNTMWDLEDGMRDERVVDTHIKKLRRKIGGNAASYIKTVFGTGYKCMIDD